VQVTPSVSNAQPGRFTIAVGSGSSCPTAAPVVVTDSLGNRVTVTVTATRGPAPPAAAPATPVTVAPSTITLACGTSGSVSAVGGTPPYSVSSSHPRVTATASGNTVTITRLAGDGVAIFPTSASISITDGASAATVTATVPANCP
jgi:hypothetical protein